MPINLSYSLAFIAAVIFSLILVPIVKIIATKLGVVDRPVASRKIHKKNIPLLGGIAIFLSFGLTIFLIAVFDLADFSRLPDNSLLAIFIASLLIIIGGFLDDKFNLKPSQQIIWPLLAVITILAFGIKISYITNPIGGPENAIIYLTPIIGTVITFIWLIGMTYTTKFLDGLDGLAGGIAAIGALVIFLLSLDWDIEKSATSFMALILCGSILGFLAYNWHPAKIFLGEGGSLWLGFMLGILSIISGSKITTTLLVIGIPALDVLWVIIQRLKKGESPFSHADQKHLHHQLLKAGLSQRQAVLFLYLIAIIFGSMAVFMDSFGKAVGLGILTALMIIIIIIINQRNNFIKQWYKK